MRTVLTILFLLLLLCLMGCSKSFYVRNPGEYPSQFIVSHMADSGDYIYYFEETGQYYIFTEKNKLKVNDTATIKLVFLHKLLKVKK